MVIGIGFVFPALCEGVFGFRVSGLFWCGSGWSFPPNTVATQPSGVPELLRCELRRR